MKAKTLRDLIRERGEPNLSNNFLRAIACTYICIPKIPNLQVFRRAASTLLSRSTSPLNVLIQ